jgi:hypothetical protein
MMEHDLMENRFTDFILDLLKPDLTKVDKARLKSAADQALESFRPAVSSAVALLINPLKDVLYSLIDKIGVQGPIVVGAAGDDYVESPREFSVADIDAFTTAAGVSPERARYMRTRPRIMKVLHAKDKNGNEVFTDDDRVRVAVGFPWLMIIQILGPIIINLILKWLGK